MRRIDIGAAFLVVVALIAFLTIADPSGGRADAPLGNWLVAGGVCLAVCVPLVLAGQRGPTPRRAAMLGIATGVLFALSAALTKSVTDQLDDGRGSGAAASRGGSLVRWGLIALLVSAVAIVIAGAAPLSCAEGLKAWCDLAEDGVDIVHSIATAAEIGATVLAFALIGWGLLVQRADQIVSHESAVVFA